MSVYDITNKKKAMFDMNSYFLNKTLGMFVYENLPETITALNLEKRLQTEGVLFITKVEDKIYALSGSLGGELDANYDFTKFLVANPYLSLTKEYNLKEDGVLIKNDYLHLGMLPLMSRFNSLLLENDITIRTALINMRVSFMISAGDDISKEGGEAFLKKIENGELGVIGENSMFDGIKIHSGHTRNGLNELMDMRQYLSGIMNNEFGINANYNMKRERISGTEGELNEDNLYPLVDSMYEERLNAINKVNEMFDLDIQVDFGGVWKLRQVKREQAKHDETIEPNLTPSQDSGLDDREGEEQEQEQLREELADALETLEEFVELIDNVSDSNVSDSEEGEENGE